MKSSGSSHSLAYIKFLNLSQTARAVPDFPTLDPVEERLLNLFASNWHTDLKITVLQAMHLSNDVSPTTAHRRLKSMRKKGLIALVSDELDNRIKYIEPTPLAHQFFAQLGQCLEEAQAA